MRAWTKRALTGPSRLLRSLRVVKAAMHYLFEHRIDDRMLRFDVVAITGRGDEAAIELIPDAFDAGF